MFEPDPSSTKTAVAPYIWAVVIMMLLGGLIVLGVLWMHPGTEPLGVLAEVGKWLTVLTTVVLTFMKSQETHMMVNSRLEAWMKDHAAVARADGEKAGIAIATERAVTQAVTIENAIARVALPAPPQVIGLTVTRAPAPPPQGITK